MVRVSAESVNFRQGASATRFSGSIGWHALARVCLAAYWGVLDRLWDVLAAHIGNGIAFGVAGWTR